MATTITEAQERFYQRYLAAVRAVTGGLPTTEHDPDEASPCVAGAVDEGAMVTWRPVRRAAEADVSALDEALGAPLHPDARAWLARWYCLPIEAAWGDETVVLFGAASDGELRRFVAAAARSAAARGAVPVAVLHDGTRVTVENATGRVFFEPAGEAPRAVAACLAEFLDALSPLPL